MVIGEARYEVCDEGSCEGTGEVSGECQGYSVGAVEEGHFEEVVEGGQMEN